MSYSNARPTRPSPLNPHGTPGDGYLSSDTEYSGKRPIRRARESHDLLEEMPEIAGEIHDEVYGLPRDTPSGVTALGAGFTNGNKSQTSIGSRAKADKVLGLVPNAKLASFYLVSGLPRVCLQLFRQPYGSVSSSRDILSVGLCRVVIRRY